jgi:hypothetical protein
MVAKAKPFHHAAKYGVRGVRSVVNVFSTLSPIASHERLSKQASDGISSRMAVRNSSNNRPALKANVRTGGTNGWKQFLQLYVTAMCGCPLAPHTAVFPGEL